MTKLKWFFMSGRKKLLYQIECAQANKQRLHLSNGVTLDFTEDKENLLRERAGLKLHCAEYKRKYKALRNILGEVYHRIDGLRVQFGLLVRRRDEANNSEEKAVYQALIKYNQQEREELQNIYDKCREITR